MCGVITVSVYVYSVFMVGKGIRDSSSVGWGGVIWSLGQFVGCVIVGGGVEILLITNKSLFVASSWSHFYLLIKDARSFEHKVW